MLAATSQLISELSAMATRLTELLPAAGAEWRVLETCQAVRATAQELQRWLEGRRQSDAAGEGAAALLAAATQLVTAAQQARFDGGDPAASRRLTAAVLPLTEAMSAVLTWWDGLSSAQVAAAQQQVSAALSDLGQVTSLQRLPPAIKVAVSELRRFAELCQQLGGELSCARSRRLLTAQLQHLLLCAQLLPAAAVCRCVHPLSSSAKMPLAMAVRGVTESAAEAAELLCAPAAGGGRRPAEQAEDGGFVRSTDGLLQLLQRCPQDGFARQLRPLLEEFLAHALAVSQCTAGEDGSRITGACQQSLEQFSAAAALQTVGPERRGEFVLACQLMADQLELAEHLVNSALLQLIEEVFTEPTRELDTLVRVAQLETRMDPDRSELDSAVADHDLAADKVFQVCGLATACSTDDSKLTLIRAGLLLLETLEPEVYPAAAQVRSSPQDPAARQHLAAIRNRWRQTLLDVRDCLDQIMDPLAFCKAVEAALTTQVAEMKEMLYDQDTRPVLQLGRRLVSLALRLGQFMMDQVKGSPHITEAVLLVNKATSQLPGAMRSVQEQSSDLGAHRLLQKVAQVVVTYVRRLRIDLEKRDEDQSVVLDRLDDISRKAAGGTASVTLLSDVNQLPVDETRPQCSRVRSRLAASSRTFNSERSRNGATAANTELSLDITKYLSYNSQSHRNASLRLRAVRVDLTPLLPRSQPAGHSSGPDPELELGAPEEMLALDADEVAAELSSLSLLIDAQPAADLSHILDSLSELAAELSQDVRDTEESLRLAPTAPAPAPAPGRRQGPPPPPGRQQPGLPAYVTAGGGAETCSTPSCGGGQVRSQPVTGQMTGSEPASGVSPETPSSAAAVGGAADSSTDC